MLFPNELLPALDLLDRMLVTRLHCEDSDDSKEDISSAISREGGVSSVVYYVRTSQQARSMSRYKYGSAAAIVTREDVSYEVRLQGWNCSCAAFAFGAFAGDEEEDYGGGAEARILQGGFSDGTMNDGTLLERPWGETDDYEQAMKDRGMSTEIVDGQWHFGGLTRGEKVPICKHLLACILIERVRELGHFVKERAATKEEIAGWAAGWGS